MTTIGYIKKGLLVLVLDEGLSLYLLTYCAITTGCLSALFWGYWGWFCVGLVLLAVGALVAYTVGRFDPYSDDAP